MAIETRFFCPKITNPRTSIPCVNLLILSSIIFQFFPPNSCGLKTESFGLLFCPQQRHKRCNTNPRILKLQNRWRNLQDQRKRKTPHLLSWNRLRRWWVLAWKMNATLHRRRKILCDGELFSHRENKKGNKKGEMGQPVIYNTHPAAVASGVEGTFPFETDPRNDVALSRQWFWVTNLIKDHELKKSLNFDLCTKQKSNFEQQSKGRTHEQYEIEPTMVKETPNSGAHVQNKSASMPGIRKDPTMVEETSNSGVHVKNKSASMPGIRKDNDNGKLKLYMTTAWPISLGTNVPSSLHMNAKRDYLSINTKKSEEECVTLNQKTDCITYHQITSGFLPNFSWYSMHNNYYSELLISFIGVWFFVCSPRKTRNKILEGVSTAGPLRTRKMQSKNQQRQREKPSHPNRLYSSKLP